MDHIQILKLSDHTLMSTIREYNCLTGQAIGVFGFSKLFLVKAFNSIFLNMTTQLALLTKTDTRYNIKLFIFYKLQNVVESFKKLGDEYQPTLIFLLSYFARVITERIV